MNINLLKSKTECRISLWYFTYFSKCHGKGLGIRNSGFIPQLCFLQAMGPRLDRKLGFWNLSILIGEMGMVTEPNYGFTLITE